MRKMLGAGKPRELANRMAELVLGASKRLISFFSYKSEDNFNLRSASTARNTTHSINIRWNTGWKMAGSTTGS